MKLAVVTHPSNLDNEHQILERMIRHGLKYLHVRKPKFTRDQMIDYLNGFSDESLEKIIIHSHHSLALSMNLKGIHLTEKHRDNSFGVWKKFNLFRIRHRNMYITTSLHKLKEINQSVERYNYVFFSPVFESISKEDHSPSYSLASIYDALHHTKVKVFALGGVDDTQLTKCYDARFKGVALSGYLWNAEDPVKNFDRVKELCNQYKD